MKNRSKFSVAMLLQKVAINNGETVYRADRLCLYLPVTVSSGVAYKNTGLNNLDCYELQNNAFLEMLNINFLPLHSWNKLPLPGPLSLLKAICHTEQGFLKKKTLLRAEV